MQSGFRSGHSTCTALANVTDDIVSASDEGYGIMLVLLDFSRAFDCINIKLLLAKMSYYGVTQSACDWFCSFLTGRKQFVEVQNIDGSIVKSQIRGRSSIT